MNQQVSIKGNNYSLEKVIAISGLGPKGTFTKEDTKTVTGFQDALATDSVNKIIYMEFEGKKIVLVKPLKFKDYGPDEVPEGADYVFFTKQLVKKLTTADSAIIDTQPLNSFNSRERPRFNNNSTGYHRGKDESFNNRRNQDYSRPRSY